MPTPLVSLTTNHRRIMLLDICSFLRQLQFGFDSVFTTESVKTPLSSFGLSSSFIDFSERHLTIGLSHDCKRFFLNLCPLAYSYLDCAFGSIWLLSHWTWRFTGFIWFYNSHDWLWSYMLWSLLLWALDSLIIWDFFGCNVLKKKLWNVNSWVCNQYIGNIIRLIWE